MTIVTTAKGVKGAVNAATKPIHNNRLDTPKPAKGYSLRDKQTDGVMKYGETTLGTKRYPASYLEENGVRMEFEASGTKRQMHDWQHEKILEYKATNGGKRPPLNKSDW